MQVKVNGDARELPDGETVWALVTRFNLTPEKVAIELNRRLLRGDKYDTALKEGDEVEIVTFVGGGVNVRVAQIFAVLQCIDSRRVRAESEAPDRAGLTFALHLADPGPRLTLVPGVNQGNASPR